MNSDLAFFRVVLPRLVIAVQLSISVISGAWAEGLEGPRQNHCAMLGGDFVAVSGARGCVRIGGHIRAEPAHARRDSVGYPFGFGAVSDGVRRASETVHVRAGAPVSVDALPW